MIGQKSEPSRLDKHSVAVICLRRIKKCVYSIRKVVCSMASEMKLITIESFSILGRCIRPMGAVAYGRTASTFRGLQR